jgi:hypothetical protein
MTCPICWDDMDMKEFKDERQSTSTCFKLECQHSFHTSCIIDFLAKTHHTCPTCNQIRQPEKQLEIQGTAIKLIQEAMKNNKNVIEIRKETNTALNDYKAAVSKMRVDIKLYSEKYAVEHKLLEHKKYFNKCLSTLKATIREDLLKKGNKYVGAAAFKKDRWTTSIIDQYLIPDFKKYWKLWKIQNPRVSFPIFSISKKASLNADDNSSEE